MIIRMKLEWIDDNPFQTRQMYDSTAIRELAGSIAELRTTRPETLGLIQVPPARVVDGTGKPDMDPSWGLTWRQGRWSEARAKFEAREFRVQLAAGHSRLRAFRLLAEKDPEKWSEMPLDIAALDDQAMANIAWEENQKRRDLTAIEEAQAIQAAMEKFGWTQRALGKRWGLSQSAVANKLRLLQLPEPVQTMVLQRKLTERHARELLPVVQVVGTPALAARLAARAVNEHLRAEELGRKVKAVVLHSTRKVAAHLLDFEDWGGQDLPEECALTCRGCAHNARGHCRRPADYEEKANAWRRRSLVLAGEAAGLPVVEGYSSEVLSAEGLARARERNCSNLAVARRYFIPDGGVLVDRERWGDIVFVCQSDNNCSCNQQDELSEELKRRRELAEWRTGQEKRAEDVLRETTEFFQRRYVHMVERIGRLDPEDLRLLTTFLRQVSKSAGRVEVKLPPEAERIADVMARWTVFGLWERSGPKREGAARVCRAELYEQAGWGQAMEVARACIHLLQDEAAELEMSPLRWRTGSWAVPTKGARERAEKVLGAYRNHPDYADLRQALDEVVVQLDAAYAE